MAKSLHCLLRKNHNMIEYTNSFVLSFVRNNVYNEVLNSKKLLDTGSELDIETLKILRLEDISQRCLEDGI